MTHFDGEGFGAELPGFQYIDHVAIAVPRGSLDAHLSAYRLLGFVEYHREEAEGADRVREAMLKIGGSPNRIQLLEPLDEQSTVQKAIDRNGGKGGLHHVAFRVKDAQAAFDDLKAKGFRIIDKAPRPGSEGHQVFFVHPKSRSDTPFDVLIEVVQE